jgi:hypothetical protein
MMDGTKKIIVRLATLFSGVLLLTNLWAQAPKKKHPESYWSYSIQMYRAHLEPDMLVFLKTDTLSGYFYMLTLRNAAHSYYYFYHDSLLYYNEVADYLESGCFNYDLKSISYLTAHHRKYIKVINNTSIDFSSLRSYKRFSFEQEPIIKRKAKKYDIDIYKIEGVHVIALIPNVFFNDILGHPYTQYSHFSITVFPVNPR